MGLPACVSLDENVGAESGGGGGEGERESEAVSPLLACATHSAGGGFGNVALTSGSTLQIVDLEATASGSTALDAVISTALGNASSFNHLATSVRFNTSGFLDVRGGTAYGSDVSMPFTLGQPYKIRILADIPSHTFSVYVSPNSYTTTRLARRYAFRSTTATVAALDRFAAIVDGASGQLSVCNVQGSTSSGVKYTREGAYSAVPLSLDRAITNDGGITQLLSATGAVVSSFGQGGMVGVDPAERPYVVRTSGSYIYLYALNANLTSRWSNTSLTGAGAQVLGVAADANYAYVALSIPGTGILVRRYPENSSSPTNIYLGPGTHAAVSPTGFAIANTNATTYSVSVYDTAGTQQWTQSFPGAYGAQIAAFTLGLDGRVVLGGRYYSPITFGGPTLEMAYYDQLNLSTYLVGLDRSTGAHVFTNRVNVSWITGAGGNGTTLAVSGERAVTPFFPDVFLYDASGASGGSVPFDGFNEDWGRSGRVSISSTGRIYWERSMLWPQPTSTAFPHLVVLQ